jgi:hypothetical protein
LLQKVLPIVVVIKWQYRGQIFPFGDADRQPILLADGRVVVSVSPHEGFLHQYSERDTLGFDRPETQCHLK